MSAKQDGGPAFPVVFDHGDARSEATGMSLRDWFAGKALEGILSESPSTFLSGFRSMWEASFKGERTMGDVADCISETAYMFADSMLKARDK